MESAAETPASSSNISPSALPLGQLNLTSGNFNFSALCSFLLIYSILSDSDDQTVEDAVSGTITLDASVQTVHTVNNTDSSIVLDDSELSQLINEVNALADVSPADYNNDEDAEVIDVE